MIPKIIHFFHKEHFENEDSAIVQNYQAIYPNFKMHLWTPDVIEKELNSELKDMGFEFGTISNLENVSLLQKYLILHKHGGLYFNKDIFPLRNIHDIVGDKSLVICIQENFYERKTEENFNQAPDFISSSVGNEFLGGLLKDLVFALSQNNNETSSRLSEAEIFFNAYMRCDNVSDHILMRDKFFYQLSERNIVSIKDNFDIALRYAYGIKIITTGDYKQDIAFKKGLTEVFQNELIDAVVWPKVSCLCVSQNNERLVRRCIKSFENQLYENKELIIIYENSSLAKEYISGINQQNIKIFHVSSETGKKSLGELRNISIEHSTGDYVMQWDDDDIYDSHRIIESMIAILENNAKACVLDQFIMYDEIKDRYSLSKKRKWEGSILVEKDSIVKGNINYPNKVKGEDTPFYAMLEASFPITILKDPWLYLYVTHQNNTFDYRHHDLLVERKLYFFKTYINLNTLKLKYFRSLLLEKVG